MATDATLTPTTNVQIPKFNTSVDAPSGLGGNAQMDWLDQLLSGSRALGTTLGWGATPGGTSIDTNLYRSAAGILKTDGTFRAASGFVSFDGASAQIAIGSNAGVPTMWFGNATDTNLYRSAANFLRTDGSLQVGNFQEFVVGSALDINSAAITPNSTYHTLFTSGAGVTLTTINAGINGRLLILYNSSAGNFSIQTSSNIWPKGGVAQTLGSGQVTFFIYVSNIAKWVQVAA